eukprot:gene18390-20935_t
MQSKSGATDSYNNNANGVDSDNMFRTSKKPPKYRGVFPVGKRFRVVMQLDGVRHNLGMHATELEAARAYDKFARENNKKTNFTYPPKQGPPRQEPTTLLGHPSNLYNGKEEQTAANPAQSSGNQNEFAVGNSGNSWSGGVGATVGDSLHPQFDLTQQPLTGPSSYGNEYNGTGSLSEQYLSQQCTEPYQWVNERPQSQNHIWQQSYLQQEQQQQQQIMYQQQLHDPYLMQAQIAPDAHLVVYIPVPLPISEAVMKYVNDFHRFEQQQRLHQQQPLPQQLPQPLPQPLHPHSNQMPANTFHPAPIFKEQNKPLSQFPAFLPAPAQVQAPVSLIDTQKPSLQHPEQTASSTTPAPSMSEA